MSGSCTLAIFLDLDQKSTVQNVCPLELTVVVAGLVEQHAALDLALLARVAVVLGQAVQDAILVGVRGARDLARHEVRVQLRLCDQEVQLPLLALHLRSKNSNHIMAQQQTPSEQSQQPSELSSWRNQSVFVNHGVGTASQCRIDCTLAERCEHLHLYEA